MSPRGSSTDLPLRPGPDHDGGGAAPPVAAAGSPSARRPSRSRWRDPRLVVGVATVAVCALLGARLLGAADDRVGVWAARGSLAVGQSVGAGDLVRREVRFDGQADADRYLSAAEPLPAGSVLDRPVRAGELVPRSAVASSATASVTEVPLSVDAEAVPATVGVGSTVDVWVTPHVSGTDPRGTTGAAGLRSRLVLHDVRVLAVPEAATSLGPTATRQVIVAVDESQRRALPTSIAALGSGDVLLTVRR